MPDWSGYDKLAGLISGSYGRAFDAAKKRQMAEAADQRDVQAQIDKEQRTAEAAAAAQQAADARREQGLRDFFEGKKYGDPSKTGIKFDAQGNITGLSPKGSDQNTRLMMYLLGEKRREKQFQEQKKEKQLAAEEKLRTGIEKAGTAASLPALKRGEQAIPGLFTDPGAQPELKSVGGWKTLVPNFAVPILEDWKMLPEGAGKERTAIQDLMNVKIYDASGKQINEKEMKRIQEAMAMRGIFEPEEIIRALRQMGHVVHEKQKQVTATSRPSAVEAVKRRGGLVGYDTLSELVGGEAPKEQAAQAPPAQPTTGPKPGDVMDGYKFKGGDPANAANWEPVK